MQVHVLDSVTLHMQASWQLPPNCTAAAVSPNGCLLASAHDCHPLRRSLARDSAAQASDSHTDGSPRVQNSAGSALRETREDLTESDGSAKVSFSVLLPQLQQALAMAKPVPDQSRESMEMDIDIVSIAVCSGRLGLTVLTARN